ncbi:MAG: hypothetical protein NVS3B26_13600 [Mycobacteriales bacterium]
MTTRTPKGNRMTAMSTSRRGATGWFVAIAASSAAVVMLPSTAIAADSGTSTVRATLDAAGGVKDVKVYGPDGAPSAFNGSLPLTLAATRSVSGGSTLLSYHVENTMSQKQDVTVTDTAGKSTTSPVELQLPLVAQLGVTLPKSMKDVAAPGATISTDPDGTHHVLWQMVLFTPLGSPAQDVSLTASGDGKPSAQLRGTVVDPTNAAGVSSAAQAANANVTQDDFWHGYSSGGNDGLTKLRAGMGQIVAGLQLLAPGSRKLANGLGAAGDGANKLAAGTDKAKDGAGQLSAGLGKISAGQAALSAGLTLIHNGQVALTGGLTQIHDGAGALSTGVGQIHDGQVALTGGLTQIHDGQGALTTGIGQIHDGSGALTTGLGQIHDGQGALTTGLGQLSGGLNQLNAGLPAALSGVSALSAGVQALLAGVGTGLVPGVTQLQAGVSALQTALAPGGAIYGTLSCSIDVMTRVANGTDGIADPCIAAHTAAGPYADTVMRSALNTWAANLAKVRTSFTATSGAGNPPSFYDGLNLIAGGLAAVKAGLDNPSGTPQPGVKQGLQQVAAGLSSLYSGLATAQSGVAQLATGATAAVAGSQQLTDGSGKALVGSQQLTDGSGKALVGSQQLTDGSGKALVGSQQLADGSGKAYDGSKALYAGTGKALDGSRKLAAGSGSALAGSTQLRDGASKAYAGSQALLKGLGQIADGQHQVANGLPAAVTGATQIADGLAKVLTGGTQVRDGIGQVQDGAVAPLNKQLDEAAQNARKQVAILAAAGALAAKAPGGAGASYILDQSGFSPKLSASVTPLNDSHTGRNAAIVIGGLLLLVFGIAGGFAAGRRRGVVQH